jgi:hypothetical protein
MYVVVFFISIYVQVHRPLPPGDNPIAVNKYRIIFSSNTNTVAQLVQALLYKPQGRGFES